MRRSTSRAAAPAGSRRFFKPSSSRTTVREMTMSAPGNAAKMPSRSDINADVSSTTILLMMTSHDDRGLTARVMGGGTHAGQDRVGVAAAKPSSAGEWMGAAWVGREYRDGEPETQLSEG